MAGIPVKVRPFTGDQNELDADIRSADLVVIPSRQDGFPFTALEAARSGIPVLAGSNIGTGMFLSDPARVVPELGLPSVVPMKGNEAARGLGQVSADHGGHRFDEGVHESCIAAAVAVRSVHRAVPRHGYRFLGAGQEVVDADALAVAGQFAGR
nr:glycosyltransferase family 4 protein [Streptomyces filipinensis]